MPLASTLSRAAAVAHDQRLGLGRRRGLLEGRVDLAQAEFFLGGRHVEVVGAGEAQGLGQLLEVDGRLAQPLQFLLDQRRTQVMRCCSSTALNQRAHLAARARAGQVAQLRVEPVARGPAGLGGGDFHRLPRGAAAVFSGTIWPSTRAPRQRWPRSVCRW